MKHLRQTKYSKPKHRHDVTFVAPKSSVTKTETDKMPAYHSSGLKEYTRVIPKMRNQIDVDVRLMALLINTKTAGNSAELITDGIKLNQVEIKLTEGLGSYDSSKFRYTDLYSLLVHLIEENILKASMQDIRVIREQYYKSLNE